MASGVDFSGIEISGAVLAQVKMPFALLEPVMDDGEVADVRHVAFTESYRKLAPSVRVGALVSELPKIGRIRAELFDWMMKLLCGVVSEGKIVVKEAGIFRIVAIPVFSDGKRMIGLLLFRRSQADTMKVVLGAVTAELNESCSLEEAKRRISELLMLVYAAEE